MPGSRASELAQELAEFLRPFENLKGNLPVKPGHRVPFHWPPHPISQDFHVLPSDWTRSVIVDINGEAFAIEIAQTSQGFFGRMDQVWNEARGDSQDVVVKEVQRGASPFFERQSQIAEALGYEGRYKDRISDLTPPQLLKLLYCPNRDLAHEAQIQIEIQASSGVFCESLILILLDDSHPHRRIAQWCVLDMFEDLPSFCASPELQTKAICAIRDLISHATDDFARTIYKAGVVLGGHICTNESAEALLAAANSDSKYGRRSAIHALFHCAEWMPEKRNLIVEFLRECSTKDPVESLRDFASSMAKDVERGSFDHRVEPTFPEEELG